jgi:cytochrome c
MADDILTLDQMINFCMKNPMKGKPLGWNSQRMTALAAYVTAHSDGGAGGANPCAVNPCNPCAGKNPCAANPCAGKNPCGPRNPCNPCGAN